MKTKTTIPTLEKLIKDGKYYYVNPNYNETNFPKPEKIQTENWKIIRMKKSFTSQEALDEMKKQGCRPANIYELAQFKLDHPEEFNVDKWFLAFGQMWIDADGYRRVPIVRRGSDGGFRFILGSFEGAWGGSYCLLCFCDSELSPSDTRKTLDTLNLKPSLTLEERIEKLEEQIKQILK